MLIAETRSRVPRELLDRSDRSSRWFLPDGDGDGALFRRDGTGLSGLRQPSSSGRGTFVSAVYSQPATM